jgi:hypothetical protein
VSLAQVQAIFIRKVKKEKKMSNLEGWMQEKGWAESWAPLPKTVHPEGHKPCDIKLREYSPTSEDILSFQTKGYWVGPILLDDKDIAILRAELERVFSGKKNYLYFFYSFLFIFILFYLFIFIYLFIFLFYVIILF